MSALQQAEKLAYVDAQRAEIERQIQENEEA
jgi:hypothetical protein